MERWHQIESLFQEALQRDPAERDAYVREACRGDSGLEREVASLLENHEAAADSGPSAATAAAKLIGGPVSLEPGRRLGPYQIESFLAAGGMGEVYRATDTRLNRPVAIKVSAARFSERFEREARVIASLNHPNICTLYDVGPYYLVMEYVEGPTLDERIKQGPIPLPEALEIARQMTAALEEAHQRLVVHRDFKPGNVKIKPDGTVKVLDFGLAKLPAAQTGASANATDSPTLTLAATQAGVLLGTAAYMSPEQTRGEPVDRRCDVWAFGAVLWEMLTGKRLFQGKTTSETLAAVIRDEPDLTKVPGKVRLLLKRCLEKDPKRRLRDIGDAMGIVENTPEEPAVGRRWLPWGVAAVSLVALGALSFAHFGETQPQARVIVANVDPPESVSFDPVGSNPPTLSPDGRQIAFRARAADGKAQLWVRPLDSASAKPLRGTEDATAYPFYFWSPDSRSIAFFADGKLKRVDVADGRVLRLADAVNGYGGGSWSPQNVIVFAPHFAGGLYRVPANGGTLIASTRVGPDHDYAHRLPWFLPDGRHFLFADQTHQGSSEFMLRIGALDSPEVKTIGPANSNVLYSSGYLLYVRQNTLMAQPFDEKRLAVAGEAQPLAEQVPDILPNVPSTGIVGAFSVAREGLLAYRAEALGGQQLTWFDSSGKPAGTLGDPGLFSSVDFSPDRKRAAVVLRNQNIWIYDVARELGTPLTFGPALHSNPLWSHDGRSIIYKTSANGRTEIYRKASDGTGNEELLYGDELDKVLTSWSPDGKFLLYSSYDPNEQGEKQGDVWVLSLGPKGAVSAPSRLFPSIATPFARSSAKFSPDGHWVAFSSGASGHPEICVTPFPGPGPNQQISIAGGNFPRWREDGKEIFYIGLGGVLMAAEVAIKNDKLELGGVRSLGIPVTHPHYRYDVSIDGQRFLVAAPREQKSPATLTLVQNWTALLKNK